jgi:hypothetical protein
MKYVLTMLILMITLPGCSNSDSSIFDGTLENDATVLSDTTANIEDVDLSASEDESDTDVIDSIEEAGAVEPAADADTSDSADVEVSEVDLDDTSDEMSEDPTEFGASRFSAFYQPFSEDDDR